MRVKFAPRPGRSTADDATIDLFRRTARGSSAQRFMLALCMLAVCSSGCAKTSDDQSSNHKKSSHGLKDDEDEDDNASDESSKNGKASDKPSKNDKVSDKPSKDDPGSPRGVCRRMAALEEKGAKDKDKKKAVATDMDKCAKEMTDMKGKDPETFKCVATCSDMSDYDGAMGCLFACMLKSKDMAATKNTTNTKVDGPGGTWTCTPACVAGERCVSRRIGGAEAGYKTFCEKATKSPDRCKRVAGALSGCPKGTECCHEFHNACPTGICEGDGLTCTASCAD